MMQLEHREQFFEVIAKVRDRIKSYSFTASPESLAQYRKACDRMRKRNATPIEIAGSKRSYYFYRAALIACTIEDAPISSGNQSMLLMPVILLQPRAALQD